MFLHACRYPRPRADPLESAYVIEPGFRVSLQPVRRGRGRVPARRSIDASGPQRLREYR